MLQEPAWRNLARPRKPNQLRLGGEGLLPTPRSHRPVRARISAYGSSKHGFAVERQPLLSTLRSDRYRSQRKTCFWPLVRRYQTGFTPAGSLTKVSDFNSHRHHPPLPSFLAQSPFSLPKGFRFQFTSLSSPSAKLLGAIPLFLAWPVPFSPRESLFVCKKPRKPSGRFWPKKTSINQGKQFWISS